MWKIKRSGLRQMKVRPTEVYALEFVDKPMYLERVCEDISGGSVPQSVVQNQDIQNQSLPLEPNS